MIFCCDCESKIWILKFFFSTKTFKTYNFNFLGFLVFLLQNLKKN